MSEGSGKQDESGDPPDVVVTKGRGVGLIWLVPIVALAIGAYMAWDSFENRGEKIVISYPDAEWLEAGKTKIKFRSVEIGTVDEIIIDPDTTGVQLHCTLVKEARPHLTEGATFWIEHPRVGVLGLVIDGHPCASEPGDSRFVQLILIVRVICRVIDEQLIATVVADDDHFAREGIH